MIKLMLLGKDGMNQLLTKLGMTAPGYQLGFLDASIAYR